MSDAVVFVVPDKMGGMVNILASILAYRTPDAFAYHAVLTHNELSDDTQFGGALAADEQRTLAYRSPTENLYAVIDRLRALVPSGGGVLVANDLLELAMTHVHDPEKAVVHILHGDYDYYYDLAVRHQSVVDVWIAYSRTIADTLRARVPQRAHDVHYLPYGLALPSRTRTRRPGPLRLVFSGRLDAVKGIFDLPRIDAALARAGADVAWTIIGDGPDAGRLRADWPNGRVHWAGRLLQADVLNRLPDFDVFVLPTHGEGLPVALVEAMGAGLVPVVSDIPSGVPEVVRHGETGMLAPVADVDGFARAIAALAADAGRLEAMSRAAHGVVAARFDPVATTAAYQALFARWRELRRPWRPAPLPYRTRLDQRWLPNAFVRAARTVIRRSKGRPA